ncbi:hypothetical protein RN001_012906 [Aquatica leii]|uniref:Major facilitator superfamily (MFS) profile domain-containing protein n=1 Tax=Aquatica leii TaxID=1421715 RepID=A0AAN7PTA9_9COLE|nr:hypothetical protein RN001_012906 [Aquatica leii]
MLDTNLLYSFPGQVSQGLAVVLGTLTALSDGMQYGWTSPTSAILLSPSSPIAATENDIVLLELVYMLGGLCGIPVTMYLLDKIGRKKTILFAAFEGLLAWILISFSSSIATLLIARCILGSVADVSFVTMPVYIAEISEKNIRGCLGSIIQIMMLLGVVLIYSVGPYVSITVSAIIGASVLLTHLLTFSFMPDTPYYYLMRNRKEQARKSLQVFRSTSNVNDELEMIEKTVLNENAERGRCLDLFRVRSNLKAILILTVLNVTQHFSGISVLFMNMRMILEEADSAAPVNAVAIIYSVVMLIACVIAGLVIDQIGKKLCYVFLVF